MVVAARRAQPAVHPGQHRQGRPLPAHRGGRHRPGAQRGRRPRDRRVPRRRPAHARRALRARAGQRRRRRPRPQHQARAQGGRPQGPGGQHAGEQPEPVRAPSRRAGEHRRRARPRSAWASAARRRRSSQAAKQALAQPWTQHGGGVRRRLARLPRDPQAGAGQRGGDPARVPRLRAGAGGRRGQGAPGRVRGQPVDALGLGRRGQGPQLPVGAYHEVWSRDAYQIGTALYAMGDIAAAQRVVRLALPHPAEDGRLVPAELRRRRQAGSGPTSSSTRSPCRSRSRTWSARPTSAPTAGSRRRSRFLMRFRDEETGRQGAVHAAGALGEPVRLLTRDHRRRDRRPGDRRRHRAPARRREARQELGAAPPTAGPRKVKGWTVTTNGPLSDAPYFLRLTKDGKPNRGTTYAIGDGGPARADQRRVVDPSFLDLVRFGILAPTDPVRAQQPGRRRPGPGRADAQRHLLAPLLLRRVRRDAHRRPVGPQRGRRPTRPSAGPGRCSPASAVSTPSRPARAACPTSPAWPPPPAAPTCSPSRSGTAARRPAVRAARRARAPARRPRCCGPTRC